MCAHALLVQSLDSTRVFTCMHVCSRQCDAYLPCVAHGVDVTLEVETECG